MNVKQIVKVIDDWLDSLKKEHEKFFERWRKQLNRYEIAINIFLVQQGLRSGFLFTFPLECAPPKFEGFSMYLAKSSLGFVVNHILMLTSNPKGPIFQKFVDQAVGKPEPVMMPAIEKRIGECLGYLYPSDRLHIIHINNNVVDWCCRSVDGKISIILWSEGLPKEYD